jgi:hypothetical protein
MFFYMAYGLGIHSELALPELLPGENSADVVIRLGTVENNPAQPITTQYAFWAKGEDVYLLWKDVGTFLIRGGREIIIEALPGVEERVIRLFLLGAVLAVLLHQRGILVLHASVVVVNGKVIAFLGEKGWGKSTLAAALHARGHLLVSDDLLAMDLNGTGTPLVRPGFPQFKLWPDAISSVGGDPETLPRLHPEFEKRASPVTYNFLQFPLPLRHIFILGESPTLETESIQPQMALAEVLRHSHAVRFLKSLGATTAHFRQCVSLVNSASICRLKRPYSLAILPELTRLVEEYSPLEAQMDSWQLANR